MDRIIKHAKRSISQFSLAALLLNIVFTALVGAVAPTAALAIVSPVCNGSSFDAFTTGSVNGQSGWGVTGPYDQAIVSNTYGYDSFGCQTLRISNAVASGSFGDQTFSPSISEKGESAATNGGYSSGSRQSHYEAQFDIASTQQMEQPGLMISVSPDRGDGSRMSYLGFRDTLDGVDVTFFDVQGTDSPANFVPTLVATDLSRAVPHTVKLVIDYMDGPSNDIVKVYIDGSLVHTGTSWENYYRYDAEASAEQTTRTTDSLQFRAGGTPVPTTSGNGFLFDNIQTGFDITIPDVPMHVSPADGSTLTAVQLNKVDWNDVTNDASLPVQYYYEVTHNPAPNPDGSFASTLYASAALAASEIPTPGTPEGVYYWHVRAVDAVGNSSGWSTPWSFIVDNTPPPVTVTIAKYMNGVHATAGNTNNASFNMTAVYNASNIGSGSDPYVINATGNGTPESYEAKTIALASGADYSTYETISAPCTDATPFDLVGYSTGDSFATAEAAPVTMTVPAFTNLTSDTFVIVWNKTCPPAPTHVSPADNSTLTSAQLDKIDWSDITSDPAMPITYYYEVATTDTSTNPDGSFVNPVYVSGPLSASEIVTAGTGEGTYHWHVRAVDGAGNSSAWTTPWTVTVSNAAVDTTPPVVEILGYRNQTDGTYDNGPAIQACGTTTASSFIAFEWQEVGTDASQPLNYEYKILSGPAGVGYTQNHSDTHHNGGIPAEGTYTIQITPTDAASNVGTPVTCTMTYDADYVAPVACNVSDTDLMAHWKLDEAASATVAEDSTANANDGAVMGATSAATPATTPVFINTGSYDFDGVNDSIDMGSNVGNFTVADAFSISAWINPALDFQNHAIYGNTWSSPGYLLRVTDQNKIRFILVENGSVYEGMDSGVLTPGWHHVTGVWDGTDVKVYIDGVDASMTAIANGTVTTITTSAHTFIGQTGQVGSAKYFDGSIDDVRVYGDVLSESEIAALAAGQCQGGTPTSSSSSSASSASSASSESSSDSSESSSESSSSAPVIVACTTTGLAGYWPLNEGTGSTTFDLTGTGHDGTLQNGTAWASGNSAISPNPFGLAFDGTDDIVSVTDSNDFKFGTQEFTVSTFVRTTEGNRSVLGNFSAGHKGWGLYIYNTNQVNFFGYGTVGNNDAAKPAVVLDGDWHHITGVYKRSGNDLTIETYVDGVLVGSSTATVGDISANNTLFFGQYMPQPSLNGNLDDVRIYDRALSPSEVANLAGGCSNAVASSSSSDSSSSSMSSEGESSSESFESFQSFGLSTPEVEPGNGSFRGSRTNILGGVINFIRGNLFGGTAPGGFGGIAPGGFGGASDLPYTLDEKNIICSMKRAIPTDAKLSIWEWVASVLSEQMNHSTEQVLESLKDSSFCDYQATAKTKVATTAAPLPFLVSSAGYPLSDNPTWNACVTGKVTLQDIRNNPDKDKHGRGRSCATYHTGNMWTHPDLNIFFTWNSKTKKISLPAGYVINQQKVTL